MFRFVQIFIATVLLQLSFEGELLNLPATLSFIQIDFNDSSEIYRPLNWQLTPNATYIESETHNYATFGTYSVIVTLTNNVSQIELYGVVNVDECVQDFTGGFVNTRYFFVFHLFR